MNLFEAVKQNVTTRQAAERYGIRIRRNGMAVCPFHNDKNPSMKLDRRFHCFGCQADTELSELKAELPDKWEYYIDRLSGYIASTGRKYKNHAATIRRWAADDTAKAAPKKGIPDYSYKEGESL